LALPVAFLESPTFTIYRNPIHSMTVLIAPHDPWMPVPVPDDPAYTIDHSEQRGMLLCRGMVQHLIQAIEEERDPTSSGEDGLAALELIMATYESHRLGRPVSLPLANRQHPLEVWREQVAQQEKG
jgi:predicted dehydrogenase